MDRDKVKIELHLNRDFFIPGGVLRGRLHLTVTRSVQVKAVRLRVMGKEKALRHAHCRTSVLEEFVHLEQVLTFFGVGESEGKRRSGASGGKLAAGDYDFPFQVNLPPTLPPSLYAPVRHMKTKVYYFVEANVVMPSGFHGRKRRYVTVFPAARRSQWDYAHRVPVSLTGLSAEQLSQPTGADVQAYPVAAAVATVAAAASTLAREPGNPMQGGRPANPPPAVPRGSTDGQLPATALSRQGTTAPRRSDGGDGDDDVAAEKQRIAQAVAAAARRARGDNDDGVTMGVPLIGSGGAAAAMGTRGGEGGRSGLSSGGTASRGTALPAREMTLDEAVRLPVRGGRFSSKETGWVELSVKVLPCVMALSTRTMFPIIAASNEATNTRVNRGTDEVLDSDNDEPAEWTNEAPSPRNEAEENEGDDDDDDDGDAGEGQGSQRSESWGYPGDAARGEAGTAKEEAHPGKSHHGKKPAGKDRGNCRPSAPMDSASSSASSPLSDESASANEKWKGRPLSRQGSADADGGASEPETVCAPARITGAGGGDGDDMSAAAQRQRQLYRCMNEVAAAPASRAAKERPAQATDAARGARGGDAARVPSVVRPAVMAATAHVQGAASHNPPSDSNGSFGANVLTTYDDCQCLVRITLHNATLRKKVRGFTVALLQFVRFDSARHHASRTVKLAERRYNPPQGPLRPGQTITVDMPLELPGMLRLNGEMHKRLPLPTLRTRSLDVTNVLAVSFGGGLKLEHQFNRGECISFVSAVDETNSVPPVPAVFTQPHTFPEVVVETQVY